MHDPQANDLPVYRSYRLVRAAVITDVSWPIGATEAQVTVKAPYGTKTVTVRDLMHKPEPEPGMMLMCYDDGYVSFCPAESFEKGYTLDGTRLMDPAEIAAHKADELIDAEIARQDKMWGASNERADVSHGELLLAGIASAAAITYVANGIEREKAFDNARAGFYPEGWTGFRDYGSDVANLVVATAFLRQEIKRRIEAGEDTTRKSRDPQTQPYTGDQPAAYTK